MKERGNKTMKSYFKKSESKYGNREQKPGSFLLPMSAENMPVKTMKVSLNQKLASHIIKLCVNVLQVLI